MIHSARHLPFALIVLLAAYLLTLNVGMIWHTDHEDNGVVFEDIAITHIRYGLSFTKGQDFYDPSVQSPAITWRGIGPRGIDATQQFQYFVSGPTHPELYGHHPPLLGLTVAGSFLLFGYHYWAERLVPITFTLAALIVFYALMLLLFDPLVATFASLLFTLFPITAYFGRNVAHEAPTMFWELGMLLCYVLWTRSTSRSAQRRWLMALAACVCIGAFYGWPMVYFACILFAVDAARRRTLCVELLVATVGAALGAFAAVVAQIAVAAGGSLRTLQAVGVIRANGSVGSGYTLLGWLGQLLWFNASDFGAWSVLAALAASLFLLARFRQEHLSTRMVVLVTLALGALAHILIWRQAAYIHDYWQFYYIPFYAAAIGWAGAALARRISAARHQEVVIVVVMACFVLALNAPLIYNLYAGGLPYEVRATGPVVPLVPISPLPLSRW